MSSSTPIPSRGAGKNSLPRGFENNKVAPFDGTKDGGVHAKPIESSPPITINGNKYSITDPTWKTIAPTDGISIIKHDKNTWRWCVPCNKWMFHDITKHDFWAVRNAK